MTSVEYSAEMDKLLESSKNLSLNLQAFSSKLGLVQNEIQGWSSESGSEFYYLKHFNRQILLKKIKTLNKETP